MVRTVGNNVSSPTTTIAGGIAGQVAYQAASNVTQFTGPGTSGQVLTSTGGAQPTFQSPAPTSNLGGGTAGQVVYQSAASTTSFTGPGTSGQFLTSNGTSAPTYTTLTTVPLANSITLGTAGQILYQSGPSSTDVVGPGTPGQFLRSNGATAPQFVSLTSVLSADNITGGTPGQVLYQQSSGITQVTGPGTSGQILTSNGATAPTFETLTTVPSAQNVTGGTAGQLLYQQATGVTNVTGPGTSGQFLQSNGTSAPTYTTITTVPSAQNVTGGSAGQVLYQQSPGVTNVTGPGTSGQVLTSNGVAAPTYQAIPAPANVAGGTARQILYQSAPGVTAFTGPGTSGQILTSNGAAPPSFQTLISYGTWTPQLGAILPADDAAFIAQINTTYIKQNGFYAVVGDMYLISVDMEFTQNNTGLQLIGVAINNLPGVTFTKGAVGTYGLDTFMEPATVLGVEDGDPSYSMYNDVTNRWEQRVPIEPLLPVSPALTPYLYVNGIGPALGTYKINWTAVAHKV